MTDLLTADDAIDLLQDVVDRLGRDVRPINVYFNADKTPECLIGHVLTIVGNVEVKEGVRVRQQRYFGAFCLFDDDAIRILDCAQAMQDASATWGEALDFAKDLRREYAAA